MGAQVSTVEQKLAWIATRSHGVVTRAEMVEAGVTAREIARRVSNGVLLRQHRGVYRVGHRAPSLEARYLGAVKACGEHARLSGHAAGYLFGALKGAPPPPEVTTPTDRRVPGVKTHRSGDVESTVYRGIPITTVSRTLVDLAATLSAEDLARACHEAGVRHATTPRQVQTVLTRRPNVPGAAKLRSVLQGDVEVTLSTLERRFLALLKQEGLPLPQTNVRAGGRRVDCRWPESRLTVELDGYRYHHSRHAWQQDRDRERDARARGDEFRRYTYADVLEHPRLMLAELRALRPRR